MRHCTRRGGYSAIALTVLMLAVCAAGAFAQNGGLVAQRTRSLCVPTGRSVVLHFQRMKKVQVVEPDLVEVVVATLNDLSIYGRKAGETTVYVWDITGLHQIAITVMAMTPAEMMIQDLIGILGTRLKYSACDGTVIVEGELPAADAQRAHDIISACSKGGVQIVDLVRVEGEEQAGAAAAVAAGLAKILGDKVEYIVWNKDTLVVQGGIGDREKLAEAHKLLAAISTPQVRVIDLLEYQESAAEPPVELIQQALGSEFRVWRVAGRTVVVEGSVPSPDQLEDLNKLLAAFGEQAQIINLVRVGKPDINRAVAAIQGLIGNNIVVRPLDNEAIVIEGLVPNEVELERLRKVIESYPVGYQVVDLLRIALPDKRQVLVQVRVVDINKGDLKRLGVNWGQLSFEGGSGGNVTVRFIDQPWLMNAMSSVFGGSGDLGNVLSLGAQLDLLKQNNAARVLSEPNLLVDDGGKATINVGGEIPIPVAQTGGGGVGSSIAVEWKPFGVIMEVEPTILETGNKINVKISPEVSSLDFSNAVTIGGFVLPALRTRKASTVVTMEDGGTLVLGGLISRDQSKTVRKIPLIGDLPIIGELFRRREWVNGESELIILVSPQIVQGQMPIPAAAVPQGGLIAPTPAAP